MYKVLNILEKLNQISLTEDPDVQRNIIEVKRTSNINSFSAMKEIDKLICNSLVVNFDGKGSGYNYFPELIEGLDRLSNTSKDLLMQIREKSLYDLVGEHYDKVRPFQVKSTYIETIIKSSPTYSEGRTALLCWLYNNTYENLLNQHLLLDSDTDGIDFVSLSNIIWWKQYRQVFCFDPDFYSELSKSNIPQIEAKQLLHLPFNNIFVDLNNNIELFESQRYRFTMNALSTTIDSFFLDIREIDNDNLQIVISPCITITHNDHKKYRRISSFSFDVNKNNKINDIQDPDAHFINEVLTIVLNSLSYLISDKPDIIHNYDRGSITSKQRKNLNFSNNENMDFYDVGVQIGSAIRIDKERRVNHATVSSGGSGREVKPHLRKAHWHHFWRGPRDGERELTVKWLAPIPVNYTPDVEFNTVIHEVKKGKKKNSR